MGTIFSPPQRIGSWLPEYKLDALELGSYVRAVLPGAGVGRAEGEGEWLPAHGFAGHRSATSAGREAKRRFGHPPIEPAFRVVIRPLIGGEELPMLYVFLAVLGGLLVLALLVVFYGIAIYNNLITLRNRYQNGFAQIDVQLNRRYDLIPNLVETAKGYMKHEQETLEAVIAARNTAFQAEKKAAANPGDPNSMQGLAVAEGSLGGALSRLMAVVESYPDLKANQNMMALQEELTSTENKVSFARQGYNDGVTRYNIEREKFPAVLIANTLGFLPAQLFEIENPKARQAPQVKF